METVAGYVDGACGGGMMVLRATMCSGDIVLRSFIFFS